MRRGRRGGRGHEECGPSAGRAVPWTHRTSRSGTPSVARGPLNGLLGMGPWAIRGGIVNARCRRGGGTPGCADLSILQTKRLLRGRDESCAGCLARLNRMWVNGGPLLASPTEYRPKAGTSLSDLDGHSRALPLSPNVVERHARPTRATNEMNSPLDPPCSGSIGASAGAPHATLTDDRHGRAQQPRTTRVWNEALDAATKALRAASIVGALSWILAAPMPLYPNRPILAFGRLAVDEAQALLEVAIEVLPIPELAPESGKSGRSRSSWAANEQVGATLLHPPKGERGTGPRAIPQRLSADAPLPALRRSRRCRSEIAQFRPKPGSTQVATRTQRYILHCPVRRRAYIHIHTCICCRYGCTHTHIHEYKQDRYVPLLSPTRHLLRMWERIRAHGHDA